MPFYVGRGRQPRSVERPRNLASKLGAGCHVAVLSNINAVGQIRLQPQETYTYTQHVVLCTRVPPYPPRPWMDVEGGVTYPGRAQGHVAG